MTRPAPFPTRAEIEWHMANGRRLRAEAFGTGLAALGAWMARGAGAAKCRLAPAASGRSGADAASALLAPLTAIRSTAEILHDNPDLPPWERARFLRILLAEEQRLDRLVASLARAPGRGLLGR